MSALAATVSAAVGPGRFGVVLGLAPSGPAVPWGVPFGLVLSGLGADAPPLGLSQLEK